MHVEIHCIILYSIVYVIIFVGLETAVPYSWLPYLACYNVLCKPIRMSLGPWGQFDGLSHHLRGKDSTERGAMAATVEILMLHR